MAMTAEAQAASELWDRLIALAQSLTPGDWSRPTPCSRWDVKDLFAHLSGLQTAFDGSAPQPAPPEGWTAEPTLSPLDAATETSVVARRDWTVAQVIEELHAAKAGHVARLEQADPDSDTVGPLGPTTNQKLYGVRMFDLWVHLQDLHDAVGREVELDDHSDAARDGADYIISTLPYVAVKRAGLSDGARLRLMLRKPLDSRRTLTIEGGRGTWQDDDATAADQIEALPGALTLLLAGRGSPERWRDLDGLQWQGDDAEALVRRGRVFGV